MITKQMNMVEIMDLDDRIVDVLTSYGLDCGNCSGAHSETLEEAAKGHGVDLDELIAALEAVVNRK